jgi:hypothetical protein
VGGGASGGGGVAVAGVYGRMSERASWLGRAIGAEAAVGPAVAWAPAPLSALSMTGERSSVGPAAG